MQSFTIKSTQEIINLLENDFKHNLRLKDKHFYFIDTLIRRRAERKSVYLSSELLKKTFGDRAYKAIVNYFIQHKIIETYRNHRAVGHPYLTYKLLVSIKKKLDYQLTYKPLIRTIEYFHNTNYERLLDFEKQVLHNIEQLQLPSRFECPKLSISKSKNTGRLFHTLTNMPREQRKHLKHVDNIRLCELDGKNAQLVMLAHQFNDDEVFKDAVFSGDFYPILAHEMDMDISEDQKRTEFKRKFFNSILFNENRLVVANSKYGKAFRKLFPITFHHLIEMQSETSRATELQRTESNLFINNITKDIVKCGLFVIPIHDALIINMDDIESVQKIINDNSYSILGSLIPISIKEFCPTIDESNTTYNNIGFSEKGEGRERDKSHRGVYVVQSDSMVGQNKKTAIMNEKINEITITIKALIAENHKITVRKIQEKSGVAKSTVEKHYKKIICNLDSQNENLL
jgi:hypothetical protein